MYVCICNAVTEDDVRGCVAAGACSPREVKTACGWKPGCGSCTKRLCSVIDDARVARVEGMINGVLDVERDTAAA